MKIEVVKLKNIQGHVDSELTFHEGVNVIKGRSHGGKTTVVRGIEWVAKNRPQGKSILRRKTGKEGSSFTITTDDKINITRHRSNTANGYLIKKEGVKKISQSMDFTVKETMSILSKAKRKLKNAAKMEEGDPCLNTM